MKVRVEVQPDDDDGGYVARVPGLSIVEGRGETPELAALDAMDLASLYLECKEPEMLEFELVGAFDSDSDS